MVCDMIRSAAIFALLLFGSGSAWATPAPKLDVEATCRRGQVLERRNEKTHYQGCLTDETVAQKEMIKTWATFKQGAQAMCTQETKIGGAPSYVELLTCLQLDQQGAAASLENKKALRLAPSRRRLPGTAQQPG
jgi:hypothetical protein